MNKLYRNVNFLGQRISLCLYKTMVCFELFVGSLKTLATHECRLTEET